jgi:hypothetical protein
MVSGLGHKIDILSGRRDDRLELRDLLAGRRQLSDARGMRLLKRFLILGLQALMKRRFGEPRDAVRLGKRRAG